MKRLNALSESHPVISMIVGYLILIIFALAFLPADPADLGRATQTHYQKGAA